jgi:hypothetical protein
MPVLAVLDWWRMFHRLILTYIAGNAPLYSLCVKLTVICREGAKEGGEGLQTDHRFARALRGRPRE